MFQNQAETADYFKVTRPSRPGFWLKNSRTHFLFMNKILKYLIVLLFMCATNLVDFYYN